MSDIQRTEHDRLAEWFSPQRFFLDAPKQEPGTAYVLASDFLLAQAEINRLRRVLRTYESCRHACITCFCTREAQEALRP